MVKEFNLPWSGAGEIVKILLQKHENPITITNVRNLVWRHVLSILALGRQRQEDHWHWLASQPSRSVNVKSQWEMSYKSVWIFGQYLKANDT